MTKIHIFLVSLLIAIEYRAYKETCQSQNKTDQTNSNCVTSFNQFNQANENFCHSAKPNHLNATMKQLKKNIDQINFKNSKKRDGICSGEDFPTLIVGLTGRGLGVELQWSRQQNIIFSRS